MLQLADFPAHQAAPDGLQTYCRQCFAQMYREKRERAGHLVRPAGVPEGHKFCRTCQKVKPMSEWAPRKSTVDGYAFRCRECMSRRDREKHLATTYGLSIVDVADLLDAQAGLCLICQQAPAVHVDHCHRTGEIRGMLCFRCNAALGQFDDDPDRLRRAAEYLGGRQ